MNQTDRDVFENFLFDMTDSPDPVEAREIEAPVLRERLVARPGRVG